VIGNLMMIAAKGGNYLINVPPGPTGEWATSAEKLLQNMSVWMGINGEALQDTSPLEPYEIPCGDKGAVAYLMSKATKDHTGVVVYVLVPATIPSGEALIAASPVRGQPTGARSGAKLNNQTNGDDVLRSASAAAILKLSSFRAALMNPALKLTNVELLGVPGQVHFRQEWDGLTLDPTKLLPSPLPSFLSNGVVYKLMFDKEVSRDSL
jgi:hypothetical protein